MKMKSLKLSLVTAMFLTGAIGTTASAVTIGQSNNNVGVLAKIIKSQNIDKMIQRTNALDQYIENYILLTGNTSVSESNLTDRFKLNSVAFTNFTGSTDVNIAVDTDNFRVDISKLFDSPIDKTTLDILKASSVLASNGMIVSNQSGATYNPEIYYQFSPEMVSFVMKLNKIKSSSNNIVSETEPSDTSKTWYKPDGNGGFDVFKYDSTTGKWVSAGSLTKSTGIVVSSKDKLDDLKNTASIGTKAYVKDGDNLDEYVFDGTNWSKVSGGSSSSGSGNTIGVFTGTADSVAKLITKLSNVALGSKVTVNEVEYTKTAVVDDPSITYWVANIIKNYPYSSTQKLTIKKFVISLKNLAKIYNNGYSNNINNIFHFDDLFPDFKDILVIDTNQPETMNDVFAFHSSNFPSVVRYYPLDSYSYDSYNSFYLQGVLNNIKVYKMIDDWNALSNIHIDINSSVANKYLELITTKYLNDNDFIIVNNYSYNSYISNYSTLKNNLDNENITSGSYYLVDESLNQNKNIRLYVDKSHGKIVCAMPDINICKNISPDIVIPYVIDTNTSSDTNNFFDIWYPNSQQYLTNLDGSKPTLDSNKHLHYVLVDGTLLFRSYWTSGAVPQWRNIYDNQSLLWEKTNDNKYFLKTLNFYKIVTKQSNGSLSY